MHKPDHLSLILRDRHKKPEVVACIPTLLGLDGKWRQEDLPEPHWPASLEFTAQQQETRQTDPASARAGKEGET